MGARRFQDLICWQLARALRRTIAGLLTTSSLARDGDLARQVLRAARSVTANIAEGFPARTHAEFARFLNIAGRSIREVEDRLIEAVDRGLISPTQAAPVFTLAKRTSVAIARLAAYLRRTPEPPRRSDKHRS